MAPDRGPSSSQDADTSRNEHHDSSPEEDSSPAAILAARASEPQNFTVRGVLVGLAIGIIICFSNTYFGLQTGWVSGMAMPSALLGFAYFKAVRRLLAFPFSPVENVLVQSVAGAVGTMPLGCGFVAVIPALEYLLKADEGGPLRLGLWKLIVWAVGICFFGVVFAVPLRRQVIIRERLRFPSGTATALMIGVLHGEKGDAKVLTQEDGHLKDSEENEEEREDSVIEDGAVQFGETSRILTHRSSIVTDEQDWKAKIRLLLIAFGVSAFYTLVSYFIPQLRDIPIFGPGLASNWLWTLNPSPAYVGQGIIMGPATTLHMLLGAIVGWGILSPLAKYKGWAPGNVSNWETGSKGWIVWVSLAIMLADSLISLGWLILRPAIKHGPCFITTLRSDIKEHGWKAALTPPVFNSRKGYSAINSQDDTPFTPTIWKRQPDADSIHEEADAPPEHLIGTRTTVVGLILSLALCIIAVQYAFPHTISIALTILALLFALLLSIMGVRALGETDLNPVSGISKLTQLAFALIVPSSNPNTIIINLIAGALSESGALQAGDLMQDLKAGHLLGASPAAQFWGQMIGGAVGAVVAACVYRLYTHVYAIPGGLFQVPTGFVWIFTARLVTGKGLPEKVVEWAMGFGAVFAVTTALRTFGNSTGRHWLASWVPGGIAVAVGMYNTPSFTLARTIGGLISLYWQNWLQRQETPIIVLASGLILGEGLFSIVNLLLASMHVPHL